MVVGMSDKHEKITMRYIEAGPAKLEGPGGHGPDFFTKQNLKLY